MSELIPSYRTSGKISKKAKARIEEATEDAIVDMVKLRLAAAVEIVKERESQHINSFMMNGQHNETQQALHLAHGNPVEAQLLGQLLGACFAERMDRRSHGLTEI